jgi:hypothetical protein
MTQNQQRFSNQQISTDLNSFKRDAIAKIYQGKPLTGKDGIFSDMIKCLIPLSNAQDSNKKVLGYF